ncbi:hypothetical protein ABKV19_013351, partial [Rosa sericea]
MPPISVFGVGVKSGMNQNGGSLVIKNHIFAMLQSTNLNSAPIIISFIKEQALQKRIDVI